MSREISRVCNLQVANGALNDSMRSSVQVDQAAAVESGGEFSAGTGATGTALPYGAITPGSEGTLQIQNMDPTNYAQLGIVVSGTFYPVFRLRAGNGAVSPATPGPPVHGDVEPGVQLYTKAHTSAVLCEFLLLQL